MKKYFVFLLLLAGFVAHSQSTVPLRGDTVKIYKQGGTAELIVQNKTKDTTGIMVNIGNGLTAFMHFHKLNDTTYILNKDTLVFHSGSGGGGGPDSAVVGIQGVIVTPTGSVRVAKADTFFTVSRSRLQKTLDSMVIVNNGRYISQSLGTNFLGIGLYASKPTGQGSGIYWATDSLGFFLTVNNGSTYTRMTDAPGKTFNLYAKLDGGRGIMMLRGADSSFYMKGLVDSIDLHCVLNADSTVTCRVQAHDSSVMQTKYRSDTARANIYNGLSVKGSRVMTDPTTGLLATQAEQEHGQVRLTTAAALPTNSYSNGTAGVGATLTASSNGALSVDGVAVAANDRILVKNEALASHNGIYIVTQAGSGSLPYILTRGSYSSIPRNMEAGSHVFTQAGSTNANLIFYQQTTGTITFGTTNLFYSLQGGYVLNLGSANGVQVGILGSRPAATGSGNFYLSTTDSVLYYDVSTGNWIPVGKNSSSTSGLTKPSFLGTLYAGRNYANTADFTNVGSPTVTASSLHINVSGGNQTPSMTVGTNNTAPNQVLKITAYGGTMLERWSGVDTFIINSTPGSTTTGEGLGMYSISTGGASHACIYFNGSTNTGGGSVALLLGSSFTTAAVSPTSITFSAGDTIVLYGERIGDRIVGSVRNQTTKSTPATVGYTYDQSNATNILTPNTSNLAIFNFGGSYSHVGINFNSNEAINATMGLGGDSKFAGYATAFDQRIGSLLNQWFPATIVSAGQGDRTADFIAHLTEFIKLNPGLAILCIGRNDIAGGVGLSTMEANLDTIAVRLTRAGIPYFSLDAIYETNTSQTNLINFLDTAVLFGMAQPTRLIQVYAAGSAGGNVATDGVHENYAGARIVADRIHTDMTLLAFTNGKFLADRTPYRTSVISGDSAFFSAGSINMNAINANNLFYNPTIFRSAHDIIFPAGGGVLAGYGAGNQVGKFIPCDINDAAMKFLTSTGGILSNPIIQFKTAMGTTTAIPTTNLALTEGGSLLVGGTSVPFTFKQGDVIIRHDAALRSFTTNDGSHENEIVIDTTTATTGITGGSMLFRIHDSAGRYAFFQSPKGISTPNQTQTMTLSETGALLLNTVTDDATALFNMNSTTRGFLSPRLTTTQQNAISSPTTGLTIFNTDSANYCIYTGAAWRLVSYTAAGGASFYQTVQSNSSSQTQRPRLNFSTDFTIADNSGNTSTDISLATTKVNSGAYLPTITNGANAASSSPDSTFWTRSGNIVTVFGSCTVTPTAGANTSTVVTLTLPVASHFGNSSLWGTGETGNTFPASILKAHTSDNQAALTFISIGTSAQVINYSYSYIVQ